MQTVPQHLLGEHHFLLENKACPQRIVPLYIPNQVMPSMAQVESSASAQ
jgi:hypothetical protein